MFDIKVNNQGSIILLIPQTEKGRNWLDDNTHSESWQWIGGGLACDPRAAWDLYNRAFADGLHV